ncbi:Penicillin-insensitive murein endopeptidase [uncultured Gammaproteobacteria bacterium]
MAGSWRVWNRLSLVMALALVMAMVLAGPMAWAEQAGYEKVSWSGLKKPSLGTAKVIGAYFRGCVAGAVPLASEGAGYQVMRLSRNRYYGHPELVDFLRKFGQRVAAAGLGLANIGDLSQPRGGPMAFGHASHQNGLDVDIWLRLDLKSLPHSERELKEKTLVDVHAGTVARGQWTDAHAELIHLATTDSRVARVFVNPAIKIELCRRSWPDRSWLHFVRPWYGHDDHMHVRLRCPADSPQCEPQTSLPEGEGCDSDLSSWLQSARSAALELLAKPRPSRPPPRPTLPAECTALLHTGG